MLSGALRERLAAGDGSLFPLSLDPSDANELVNMAAYSGQRSLSRSLVAELGALMRAGRRVPFSLLTLAYHQGRLFLLDGQHRLQALASIGGDAPRLDWAVRVFREPPDRIYALLDTVARVRPAAVRMAAMGVDLERRMLGVCNAAAAFMLQHHAARPEGRGPVLLTERETSCSTRSSCSARSIRPSGRRAGTCIRGSTRRSRWPCCSAPSPRSRVMGHFDSESGFGPTLADWPDSESGRSG